MQPRCNFRVAVVFTIGLLLILLKYRAAVPAPPSTSNIIYSSREIIAPDLSLVSQYRTSQLAYIDSSPVQSRKVHYRYTGSKTPEMILVLGLNSDLDEATLRLMLNDKVEYAKRHNYGLFCRYLQDTAPSGVPFSDAMGVAKLGLVRQVLDVFPDAKWVLNIDANSIVTNPEIPVDELVLPGSLTELAKRGYVINQDQPHVKTYQYLRSQHFKLVLPTSGTGVGISTRWFFIRNSLEAKALLEFGSDPLNQQYQEFHKDPESPSLMLTHIVLWHPRFLALTAIIDQNHLSRPNGWQPKDALYFGNVRYGLKVKEINHIY